MQPRILLPLAVVAAALAVPAAANAAVTTTIVDDTHITFTGDAAADNITLGVDAAGLITHNLNGPPSTDFGGGKTFKSDGKLAVTVKAGDGNDKVKLSGADLAPSPVGGEARDG